MKQYRRIVVLPLVLLLALSVSTGALAYHVVGLENFVKGQEYGENFTDVPADAWYHDNVAASYEYSLVNGRSETTFGPDADITLAEALTISDRIFSLYFSGETIYFDTEGPYWYSNYVTFAKDMGIIAADFPDYNAPATRAQFAEILSASVDSAEFTENGINWVDDGAIPDVPMDAGYSGAVYMLYRAGVLAGSDGSGSFKPDNTITRAEAAAIVTRIVDPDLRISLDLYGAY